MDLVVPHTATIGQVSVAFASHTKAIQNCRPQGIVGQFIPLSASPGDQQILLMQDPSVFQTFRCPIEAYHVPCIPEASDRLSLLLQQEAWVAKDEMDFYLQSLQSYLAQTSVPSAHILDDPFQAQAFGKWFDTAVEANTEFCTALVPCACSEYPQR